jgi:hypothetical protein
MELATPLLPTSAIDINADKYLDFMNEPESPLDQAHSHHPPHPHPPDRTLFGTAASECDSLQSPYQQPHSGPYVPVPSHYYYVDPPAIPLPSPPSEGRDNDHHGRFHLDNEDNSAEATATPSRVMLETNILAGEMPTLTRQSTLPEIFAAELDHVEMELGETRHAVQEGEMALERLEELVRELHPP